MVESSMKFLTRKKNKKPVVNPSMHVALLRVVDDHFDIDITYDLSHFDFEEMQGVIEYIEDIDELKSAVDLSDMFDEDDLEDYDPDND